MAFSLATAAIGSALIGGAASLNAASQQKKAANKALAAQTAANDKSLAAQQENFNRIAGYQEPTIYGGQGAFGKLLAEFGVTPTAPTTSATSQPASGAGYTAPSSVSAGAAETSGASAASTPQGGSKTFGGPAGTSPAESGVGDYPGGPRTIAASGGDPNWQAYWDANPDLAQNNASTPTVDLTGDGQINDADRAAKHYQEFGQTEGRALPTNPTTPAYADPNAPPDLINGVRPDVGARPAERKMGDYGSAPDMGSFFSNFEADPGAAYRRSQALDGVNASSAVRGKLRSGDAVKALATLSSDLASQEYNNWFNRQSSLYDKSRNAFTQDRSYEGNLWDTQQKRDDSIYNYDAGRSDQNFNTDRSYQTSQYNTRVGNLFDIADMGTNAAGSLGSAGTNLANNQSNIFGSQANAASDAAYSRAQANAYAGSGIANAAGNVFANWGGGGAPASTAGTVNLGQVKSPFGNYGSVGIF